jgi:hypothetical protein
MRNRALITWLPEHPELKKAIEKVAQNEENPGIRKTAEAALVSGGEGV